VVARSDGYPSDDDAETAQVTYKRMLRDSIAPALRKLGFRGSGNTYRLLDSEHDASLRFVSRKWSTRHLKLFRVELTVQHWSAMATWRLAADEARKHELRVPLSESVYWHQYLESLVPGATRPGWHELANMSKDDARLAALRERELRTKPWWELGEGTRIVPWDGWWDLPAGGPVQPLASAVLDAINEYGLPALRYQLTLEPEPTPPPSPRPTRQTDIIERAQLSKSLESYQEAWREFGDDVWLGPRWRYPDSEGAPRRPSI
jgi:hypothetical protein